MNRHCFSLVIGSLAIQSAFACCAGVGVAAEVVGFRVINTHARDGVGFTQGLLIEAGDVYESNGRYAGSQSGVRRLSLKDGKVIQEAKLENMFGEGLAFHDGKLFQLTWKNKKLLAYERETLKLLGTFDYDGEGWGLTSDGVQLIASDGTNKLRYIDAKTQKVTKDIPVYDGESEVRNINELEFVDGLILANIWKSNKIAAINPSSGLVNYWIDLEGIHTSDHPEHVLNGIAWDPDHRRLYVTGKCWKNLYQIETEPPKWR